MEIESSSQPETPHGEATWNPEDLRRYLVSLAYNNPDRNFCLQRDKFPKHIILSPSWHEIFNRMRVETAQDEHERWAMVGVNRNKDKVFISQEFVRSEKPRSDLSADTMSSRRLEALNHGIPYLVGDIHSHPWYGSRLIGRLLGQDHFSLPDFYALLYYPPAPTFKLQVMFLVGPSENKAVFRSHETESRLAFLEGEVFEDIWGKREPLWTRQNVAIVRHYHLVLYKGKPGYDLIKIPVG